MIQTLLRRIKTITSILRRPSFCLFILCFSLIEFKSFGASFKNFDQLDTSKLKLAYEKMIKTRNEILDSEDWIPDRDKIIRALKDGEFAKSEKLLKPFAEDMLKDPELIRNANALVKEEVALLKQAGMTYKIVKSNGFDVVKITGGSSALGKYINGYFKEFGGVEG